MKIKPQKGQEITRKYFTMTQVVAISTFLHICISCDKNFERCIENYCVIKISFDQEFLNDDK